jgi:peptide deformylase
MKPLLNDQHPLLHTAVKAIPVNQLGVDALEYAQALIDHLKHYGGIGLAANQIGDDIRAFAYGVPGKGEEKDEMNVMFNPEIVDHDESWTFQKEACLSLPYVVGKVYRHNVVEVKWQDPNGDWHTEEFEGFTARLFQHEIDHLDGVTMLDRMSSLERKRALKKAGPLKKRVVKRDQDRTKMIKELKKRAEARKSVRDKGKFDTKVSVGEDVVTFDIS